MRKATAIQYFGSASKLYRAAGVSRQAGDKWGRVIPYRTALYLELLTVQQLKVDPTLYGERKQAKYRKRAACQI